MSRVFSLGMVLLACVAGNGCFSADSTPHPHITGHVKGNSYASTGGHFTVPFPVSPEVGGRIIHDTAESVTFHDNWGSKISFYSKPLNAESPMLKIYKTEGPEKALNTLLKEIYGDVSVIHFRPAVRGGASVFIYIKPVGPKTGVAACVQGERVYLVETDFLPGVRLISKNDSDSEVARDEWLEDRAVQLLETIQVN
jgi:hypothetical protein